MSIMYTHQVADDDLAVPLLRDGDSWCLCDCCLGRLGGSPLAHTSGDDGWLSSTARTTSVVALGTGDLVKRLVELRRHGDCVVVFGVLM